ncbi:MAG: glycosyltransferase [Deltaproteobacteria bacterium]|nr:MAG: glycosyltransferase [Deltaproteobacteria bacterium]
MRRTPRALVVAYYFPPIGGGGVNRTVKVVRGLAAAGWRVLVLTADRAAWVRDESQLREIPESVRVVRLPNPDWGRVAARRDGRIGRPGVGAGRLRGWLIPDLQVGWSALAAAATLPIAASRAVDAVYTTCPPYSAHAAGRLGRALGVPWVADFRDAWTLYPSRGDFPPLRQAFERRLEEAVLKRADHVLFASPGVRDRYVARIPGLAVRSTTVMTGFDPRDFAAARGIEPPRGRFRIVHAGSALLDDRGATVDAFLAALRIWLERDPAVARTVEVRFVGAEAGLADRIAAHGLSRFVAAQGRVPRARLASVLRTAHLCAYLAPAGAGGADPIPGKLFDAVGAERPLFAIAPPGPVRDLVDRLRLGFTAHPGDASDIASQLAELCSRVLRNEPLPAPEGAARVELSCETAVARVVHTLERVAARERMPCAFPSAS